MSRPPRRRVAPRPQRRRVFVGCEGESERGYAVLLQRLADIAGIAVHLDAALLQPGGGDPCALIEQAIEKVRQREARHGDPYEAYFIFLDTDKVGLMPQRDQRGRHLAQRAGIRLIWQEPCHEALLLRHLENCTNLRPPTSAAATQQLRQRWPQYEKGMAAVRLGERIDLAGVRRVANVDNELANLLQSIGLA